MFTIVITDDLNVFVELSNRFLRVYTVTIFGTIGIGLCHHISTVAPREACKREDSMCSREGSLDWLVSASILRVYEGNVY